MRLLIFVALAVNGIAPAQTTLGVISGHIRDELDGHGVQASVKATQRETNREFFGSSDSANGFYSLVSLSPGTYDLTVTAGPAYRPAAVRRLDLPVAGYVEQNVTLRLLSDVWQRGIRRSSVSRDHRTVLMFYGPDVDTSRFELMETAHSARGNLEPSISDVVDSAMLDKLPLAGRDVYELIALQPGAASDLATLRGPGVSVNGQRPSASGFLLNGLENNNYLVTGPLTPLPPEGIEQYRVSTNNFAAEYGRTSGYLSNAVSRRGTATWHGLGYLYGRSDALNATDVERRRIGKTNLPFSEYEGGMQLSGPLFYPGLYTSSLIEGLHARTLEDSAPYTLPTASYVDSLDKNTAASQLLNKFRPAMVPGGGGLQSVDLQRPHTVQHVIGLERIDWQPNERRHLTGAVNVARQAAPDFFWSPYPDFVSPLNRNSLAATLTDTEKLTPALVLETRLGYERDLLAWDNNHPEIPRLTIQTSDLVLPGSPQSFSLDNAGRAWELSANMLLSRERHNWKWGGGVLLRSLNGLISTPDGRTRYSFFSPDDFAADKPATVQYGAARNAAIAGTYVEPDLRRSYSYHQLYGFAQDSFRVTQRLLLHYGVRYDYFGSPVNSGAQKDTLIGLGAGGSLLETLSRATFLAPPGGDQKLYDADRNDFAGRFGFAANLRADGSTILRGSYGMFYDRPFDNLWLNLRFNDAVPASTTLGVAGEDYLNTPLSGLISGRGIAPSLQRYPLALYQPGIRTPRVHSVFSGVQQRVSESVLVEVNYAGSFGRKLLTTDVVNRQRTTCITPGARCRPDPGIDNDIDYRGNQGSSRYSALISSVRIRHRRGEARLTYTYSHAIDNQSDPLTGLLSSNLETTAISGRQIQLRPAGFTVQFDSSSDRGSADFDQRHNFTFYSYIDLPSPRQIWARRFLGRWTFAQLGAVRSGSPYSIYASISPIPLLQNRADLIAPGTLKENTGPFGGGQRLLNPASFAEPSPGKLGSSGRNAFGGPTFYNVDLSLSRSFIVPFASERVRLLLRADAYNVLNHANLGNPEGSALFAGDRRFATADYGRTGRDNSLLAVTPLAESGRQIQLMLRISF